MPLLNSDPSIPRIFLRTGACEENWLNVELSKSVVQMANVILARLCTALTLVDQTQPQYAELAGLCQEGDTITIVETGAGIPGLSRECARPDFALMRLNATHPGKTLS